MNGKHVFTSVRALPGKEIMKGVTIKPLAGQQAMLMHAELAPTIEVPTHSHPHEQLGLVIEGELEFWIADEKRTLKPGDMYAIPGGTAHGLRTGKGRVILAEVFYPVREEYLK
jgi:quercetin dioxygenase-like cupin family protein